MILEDQVCILDQAKKLKELEIEQESVFYWVISKSGNVSLITDYLRMASRELQYEIYSAFTVAELGVMLPDFNSGWHIYYNDGMKIWNYEIKRCSKIFKNEANTEAEARASMLIYLLENNFITAEEVNERLNAKTISHKEVR